MRKAAIYARYSSHKQREESIEEQIEECKKYAEANDMIIVKIYHDSAVSGKTENREDWQNMMDDSGKGIFEVLLIYTLDRMGRDRIALAMSKKELRDNGVEVISINQPAIEGPEGIIFDAIMEGFTEYYNADLARKVKRGMSDNARKCLANGSKAPLGYSVDPISKTYVIDEDQADIVRFVFDSYNNGAKISEIVKECERKHYINSNGKPIDHNVINRILKNAKYTGLYIWQDIEVPDGMPRIISDETFQLAQMRIESMKHKNAHGKAKREYLLADKVFCGKCGELWVGESGYSSTGKMYSYYKCKNARKKSCNMKAISQDKLEAGVYNMVMFELFPDNDSVERFVDYYIKNHSEHLGYDKEIERYRTQLNTVNGKIDNIMQGVMQGIGIDTAKTYLNPLEEEKKKLEYLIEDTSKKSKKISKDKLINILNSWLDISSLIATYLQDLPEDAKYDENDKYIRLCKSHMKSVLRSPVLQKVIIEADEDGSPEPKVKLGFDLSKLITNSSSGKKSSKSRNTRANTARSYSKADRSPL
jgi:DNA invertase Pin-like site-specific DNA recombinase